MTVSDNTVQVEGVGNFFKNVGKKGLNVSKKMAKNELKNPARAMDNTANFALAAASTNLRNVLSKVPELIAFQNTGKGLYLGKLV